MIFSFRLRRMLIAAAFLGMAEHSVLGEASTERELPVLQLSGEPAGMPIVQHLATTVRWEDREYDIETGIELVMSIVRSPEKHQRPWSAATALGELANLGTQLNGRSCLDELATLFDGAGEPEKLIILTCFKGSRDPRGVPLFTRTLAETQNMKLRLSAADGLAKWNIRRGVSALVDLLDSNEVLAQPARLPYVRDNAVDRFRRANTFKGWGFPDEELRRSVEERTDLSAEQVSKMYAQRIKKWFAENEHRFPEWKLGDPLPETKEKRPAAEKPVTE